jgi:hypothetical protein
MVYEDISHNFSLAPHYSEARLTFIITQPCHHHAAKMRRRRRLFQASKIRRSDKIPWSNSAYFSRAVKIYAKAWC